jgi:hypothetical protein
VKEELQTLSHVATEGVADKYAEREFNIPDPNTAMNQKANAAIPTKSKGEYVGDVIVRGNKKSRVFLNPETLEYFERSVRALTAENADLFVCESSEDFYHKDVEKVAHAYYMDKFNSDNSANNNNARNYNNARVNEYHDDDESPDINRSSNFAGWYRDRDSNLFNAAGSNFYKGNVYIDSQYIDKLKSVHPNFDFSK